ncbi:MAG: hypothetical protein R2798_04015 [Chitinophagales bacterium]|nr:hypothetical protein [Bacteroidota bacterium]
MSELSFKQVQAKHSSYYEYLIDGVPLKEILGASKMESISPFGVWNIERQLNSILQLQGKAKPTLESGRIIFYECPECGDFDCGAVTAEVQKIGEQKVWRNFAMENPQGIWFEAFEPIKPIFFDKTQYYNVLEQLKNKLISQ